MGMSSIAAVVAAGAAISPRTFLRPFGIREEDVTGAAEFGWRLFAVRTGYIAYRAALRNDGSAVGAFLPVQLLDQAVFWEAFASRRVPRRAALLAAAASGGIIALDIASRRGPARGAPGTPRADTGS